MSLTEAHSQEKEYDSDRLFRHAIERVRLFRLETMQTTEDYQCAYCGESSTTFIDLSAGYEQSYIEDCQVCCRPNQFFVSIDRENLEVQISTDYRE